MEIEVASSFLRNDGQLNGNVKTSTTCVREIAPFLLKNVAEESILNAVAYSVTVSENSVVDQQFGGLFFGVSTLQPGSLNGEYYFTKGHYHKEIDTGEYYWGISGHGLLLLHSMDGNERVIKVSPGSVLYIPGKTAHRLVNTGEQPLVVGAVWQSISGHAYSKKNIFKTHVLTDDNKGYQLVVRSQY